MQIPTIAHDDDADSAEPIDIAGFEGRLTGEAWRLDETGNRVETLVMVRLRGGVSLNGKGSGWIEYLSPTTGRGVSDFLPAPQAAQLASMLFEQEWRMFDDESVPVEDDPLPTFRTFTMWAIAYCDDAHWSKPVKITFSPTGEPTTVEWLQNNGTFTSTGDERANRDLYGAIFGT